MASQIIDSETRVISLSPDAERAATLTLAQKLKVLANQPEATILDVTTALIDTRTILLQGALRENLAQRHQLETVVATHPDRVREEKSRYSEQSLAGAEADLPILRTAHQESLAQLVREREAAEQLIPGFLAQTEPLTQDVSRTSALGRKVSRLAETADAPLDQPTRRLFHLLAELAAGETSAVAPAPVEVIEPIAAQPPSFLEASRNTITTARSRFDPYAPEQGGRFDVTRAPLRRGPAKAREKRFDPSGLLEQATIDLKPIETAQTQRSLIAYMKHHKLQPDDQAAREQVLLDIVTGSIPETDLQNHGPLFRLSQRAKEQAALFAEAQARQSVGTAIIEEVIDERAAETLELPLSQSSPGLTEKSTRDASSAQEPLNPITLKLPALSAALEVNKYGVMRHRTLADIGKDLPGVKMPDFKRSGPKGNNPQRLLRGTTKVQELMTKEVATVADVARTVKATTVAELLDNPRIIIDEEMRLSLQNFSELTITDLDGLLSQFGPPSNRLAKLQTEHLLTFKSRLRATRK